MVPLNPFVLQTIPRMKRFLKTISTTEKVSLSSVFPANDMPYDFGNNKKIGPYFAGYVCGSCGHIDGSRLPAVGKRSIH